AAGVCPRACCSVLSAAVRPPSVPPEPPAGGPLRRSVALACHAERWGFHRYWVADHHNTRAIPSSAPAVLVGQVASATATIRVGSGGVMLPNHAPLVVAEQFGMLEALYPGRIDLGNREGT